MTRTRTPCRTQKAAYIRVPSLALSRKSLRRNRPERSRPGTRMRRPKAMPCRSDRWNWCTRAGVARKVSPPASISMSLWAAAMAQSLACEIQLLGAQSCLPTGRNRSEGEVNEPVATRMAASLVDLASLAATKRSFDVARPLAIVVRAIANDLSGEARRASRPRQSRRGRPKGNFQCSRSAMTGCSSAAGRAFPSDWFRPFNSLGRMSAAAQTGRSGFAGAEDRSTPET
jgi:hypothetical protein